MGIGSGLGGSLGIGPETTYGTTVAPTRFYPILNESLRRNKRTVQGGGISGGTLVNRGGYRKQPTQDAGGSVEMEVTTKNLWPLLAHITGTPAVPVSQGGGVAFDMTMPVVDNWATGSFTAQAGIPDLGGTVRPYTFGGCVVSGAEFSCDVDGLLTASLDVDARRVTEDPSLTTPAYPAGLQPFHFGQCTVNAGATVATVAAVDGVSAFSLRIGRQLKTDRFYFGAGGLKSRPVSNGKLTIEGDLTVDFITKADFADRFAADTGFALVIGFQGVLISGAFFETLTFTMPQCFLDGETPALDDEDVVSLTMPFQALFNGTDQALSVYHLTADAA